MKLSYLSALLAILLLASCSKKSDPTPAVITNGSGINASVGYGSVVINGATYSTIVIGSQTWTSLNYSGGTGSLAVANATFGNYYTLAQASVIPLPTGWRIPTRADYNNLLSNFTSAKNGAGDYSGNISVARSLADTTQFQSLTSLDFTMKPTNSSGFSAYPGGEYDLTNHLLNNQYIGGAFLSSTTGTVNSATVTYFFGITADGVAIAQSYGYFAGLDYKCESRVKRC